MNTKNVQAAIAEMEKEIWQEGVVPVGIGCVAHGGQGPGSCVEIVIKHDPNIPKEYHYSSKTRLELRLEKKLGRPVRMATLDSYERGLGKKFFRNIEII